MFFDTWRFLAELDAVIAARVKAAQAGVTGDVLAGTAADAARALVNMGRYRGTGAFRGFGQASVRPGAFRAPAAAAAPGRIPGPVKTPPPQGDRGDSSASLAKPPTSPAQ